MRGERAIGPVELFDTVGLRARLAAEARGFDLPGGPCGPGGPGPEWSRTSILAWNAAREAIAHARLDVKSRRVGLVVGGTTGGMFENEPVLADLHSRAHEALSSPPVAMLSHPLSATGDCLHTTLGPFGRIATLCSACSSGANALLTGALWLASGELDAVVAGGTDGLCRLTFHGFNALQAIDPEPCRPFDRRRRGLNLGEGAGFVVLERASDASARGAVPIAELAGWAASAEAHHITNPEPGGGRAAATLSAALARAGLAPADVDYVNAHGTATPLNDSMESAALHRALGGEVERVLVSSSKGQIGHTLGAAGAIEAVLTALAVQRQEVPPTAGLDEPDPACPLVHVPHVGRQARVRAALSSSFGFGGMDTVLVLSTPTTPSNHSRPAPRPPRRGVVVTGAATLSLLGLDDASTASRLLSPIGPAGDAPPGSSGDTPDPPGGALAIELSAHLDVARARRLDRCARMGVVVCERALGEAAGSGRPIDRVRLGVALGTAFGSVDPTAAFVHRLYEKGARLASPAEFPNLVPSSPVGHVTIYLGTHGPAVTATDLATSGESAVAQAADLVALGEADAVVAGGVEEASVIVESVFMVLFGRPSATARQAGTGPLRGEGAGVVVLEAADHAEARGARVLARLAQVLEWRDPDRPAMDTLEPPRSASRPRVVVARPGDDADVSALLAGTEWGSVPRSSCRARAGEHEALGAVALAAATSLVARGEAGAVLVVGLARGRGYAFVLTAPGGG